jgi:hypothetical protein
VYGGPGVATFFLVVFVQRWAATNRSRREIAAALSALGGVIAAVGMENPLI